MDPERGTHDTAALQHVSSRTVQIPGDPNTLTNPQKLVSFSIADDSTLVKTDVAQRTRSERAPIDNNFYEIEYVRHRLAQPPPT